MSAHDAHVLIVGGGAAGAGLAHDLALWVVGTVTVADGVGLVITLAVGS